MVVQNRWLVIALGNGVVHAVRPYKSLKRAKTTADEFAAANNDVVVWDLVLDRTIYSPFQGIDVYPD